MKKNEVSLVKVEKPEYPENPPFDPDFLFPEYPFKGSEISFSPNYVYKGIRDTFRVLGFDASNYGKPQWNPLGVVIKPGQSVVLKPNFVMHENRAGHSIESVITNGSVLRAIVDYVLIALENSGEICIVDAPQYEADYEKILDITGTKQFVDELRKRTRVSIILADLRVEQAIEKDGLVVRRQRLKGDPKGYIAIDMGERSYFRGLRDKVTSLRGSDYDSAETVLHHNENRHEYLLSKTIMSADVFINVPKLKTHRKTGVTLCLKNLIGINGDKNWIPHYRLGGPRSGGDEHSTENVLRDIECVIKDKFKSYVFGAGPVGLLMSRIIRKAQKSIVACTDYFDIRGGSWYGNDTLWRSILDLNHILLYADKSGCLQNSMQRKYLAIIDGIIGGQGDGPYHTESAFSGCVITGMNPVSVDLVAIQFMGLDYKKIPKVRYALDSDSFGHYEKPQYELHTNDEGWKDRLSSGKSCVSFKPAFSWKGHIELNTAENH